MFPRGKGVDQGVAPSKVDPDALFGTGTARLARVEVKPSKSQKGGKKKASEEVEALEMSMNSRVGLGMVKTMSSKAMKIERMAPGKYQVGTLAMGFVLQTTENKAIVSLPGGCVGTVELAEVSDVAANVLAKNGGKDYSSVAKKNKKELKISDLLSVNQMVRVYVMQQMEKGKKKRNDIALSMRSSYINRYLQMKNISAGFTLSGCIASEEDHGYVVSAGISSYSFFMPSKNVSKSSGGGLVKGKSYSIIVNKREREDGSGDDGRLAELDCRDAHNHANA